MKKANLPEGSIDVIFGGPPCQGFSLIGKRCLEDERNQLFLHFARLVREIRPRYFILENVPGLLLGRSVELIKCFKKSISKAGFDLVEPVQVLNAQDFGVPQKRKRTFLLGFRRDVEAPRYPEPTHARNDRRRHCSPNVWDAIGDLPNVDEYPELMLFDRYFGELGEPSDYARQLRSPHSNINGLGGCRRTMHSEKICRRFSETEPGTSEKTSRFFRLKDDGMALTLRAGTGPDHGSHTAARPIHPKSPRCITTREAARLHSFPDWFEFHPTKWHGFKQIGNSVPPRMAKAVADSIFPLLIA